MEGDGSKRAFMREFHKVVEAADVVIEVLDARDPAGTRCVDVERAVLRSGLGGRAKHLVLLLNKIGRACTAPCFGCAPLYRFSARLQIFVARF